MRGFPLLNLLAVVAVLLLMLWPLLRLERPPADVPALSGAPAAANPATVRVFLGLRFAEAPQSVRVRLGEELVALRGSGLDRQAITHLIPDDRSLELEVEAVWPPGTGDSVIEVRAAPDGMPEQLQNIWGEDGSASDIIRFSWRVTP